jgi:stearoyl-CoA desaturase (delta-9 desaturase)
VRFRRWLTRDHQSMSMSMRASFASALSKSKPLATTYYMRQELTALWQRSSASREQLVKRLEDWCRAAEQSHASP